MRICGETNHFKHIPCK